MIVQPTVGSISDYTVTRWGRRKPYIFIGSLLDVVFLIGIATSNTLVAIAAFIVLLQFSSNFAQGPFQGYVPDLVPAAQVGMASALVGLMPGPGQRHRLRRSASIGRGHGRLPLGLVALGVIELVTMLRVVIRVDEGRRARAREGTIAGGRSPVEAWGTDILRERSFLFAGGVAAVLPAWAGAFLITYVGAVPRPLAGAGQKDATGPADRRSSPSSPSATSSAIVPAARLSDRIGRKPVIYARCAIGRRRASRIVRLAPSSPIAFARRGASYGVWAGTFLAVDWALMTDIIPKASSGRYMGISNVATASAGVVAAFIGGDR